MAPADPRDKTILAVDDDMGIVHLLMTVLIAQGFQVTTAGDGREALDAIEKSRPDAVILDLMMPGYGGFDLLKQLQNGRTASIPIVIITARHMDGTMVDMMRQESNVAQFMTKPLDVPTLIETMHRILGTENGEGRTDRRTAK